MIGDASIATGRMLSVEAAGALVDAVKMHARSVLPEMIRLQDAVVNWANVAAFVAAIARGDVRDIGRAVVDQVIEPARSRLIPGFADVKRAALEAGAHGWHQPPAGAVDSRGAPRGDAHRHPPRAHGAGSRAR